LQAQSRDAIQRALEELPLPFREVILLCDVEEMKYQEIADMLGIPIGTVMSRLGRGRRMMRTMLKDEVRDGRGVRR
jgi:RNA polymerase sigma-70 factor (ECF subfamily)